MKTVAKVLIVDKQGRILVLRRSDSHPHFAHHFNFPGGEVERDEDPTEAVAHEIKEETGLIVEPSDLELCFSKNLPSKLKHMLFIATRADITPKISTSWEHDGYTWLTTNDLLEQPLPTNTDPYYVDVMEWLYARPTDLR
jgi:8-oxo-dGTP diphosphatase